MTKESGDTSKKEVGTTSTPQFQCPTLKPSNYSLWAIRMQIILEANGLWEMIEPNEKTQADNKKDKTAIAFLYQALPEEQQLQITKHKTAKAIWDALKTRHIGEERVQQARLQTLKSDFEMLHMKEDETIDTFTAKLTTLVNKAASLGHTMKDETLVRKLLNAVPDRYLQIVASIEQYSDLSEMTLEEAIERLKTYEERIKYKRGKQVDNQEKLMFTRHENKGKYFRGRGRGKHRFSQGRNHENFKEERKDGETSHKSWHFANKCPSKKEEQSNLIEEDLEPTLLMATVEETPGSFVNQEESQRVGSKNLDGGVTESMSRPGIKEDIYAARTPIGRQSVGSITNQKHDQSGFMIDHNSSKGGCNQKNMINLDLRKITAVKVEVTEEKLIYLDVRMITSTTRNQSSSSSIGGFNQKMDQEDLKIYVTTIVIKEENVGDIWRWKFNEDGGFAVKELTRLVEERTLDVENAGEDTSWFNLVPKKVNIFVWRALKRRLPVREELDKRGIDFGYGSSVLCCDSLWS
ncbi:zinc finger, CCHC-type containing protein [Tanacetum coccineum]